MSRIKKINRPCDCQQDFCQLLVIQRSQFPLQATHFNWLNEMRLGNRILISPCLGYSAIIDQPFEVALQGVHDKRGQTPHLRIRWHQAEIDRYL